MNKKIKIRKAKISDAPIISRFLRETIRKTCSKDYRPDKIEKWAKVNATAKIVKGLKKSTSYVAIIDNKIVGVCSWNNNQITGVYIRASKVGMGIGSALLAYIEKQAIKTGIHKLRLDASLTAVKFYKKNGYRRIKTTYHAIGGCKLRCVLMSKKLFDKTYKIKIRYTRLSDAKDVYKILSNPNFEYFESRPKTLQDEIAYLKSRPAKRKNNEEYNYTILVNGCIAGGIGIMINKKKKNVGEIGYFIAEKYWGEGIIVKAVKIAEKIGFTKFGLKKIEIIMQARNKASIKVAVKSGYKKKRKVKKGILARDGKKYDAYVYDKTVKEYLAVCQ